MKPSPLTFARDFEQLRSRRDNQPAADMRLLLLVEFWPELSERRDENTYRSYFDEFTAFLKGDISEKSLIDLLPHELDTLLGITLDLHYYHRALDKIPGGIAGRVPTPATERGEKPGTHAPTEIEPHLELLALEAARKYFYVGAVERAMGCLGRAFNLPVGRVPTHDDDRGEKSDIADGQESELTPFAGDAALSELDLLRAARQQLIETNSPLVPIVSRILRDWEIERIALSYDEARCLFVEKNSRGEHSRGRLRTLHGSAEYRRPGATNHEVTVDNQLRTPDDPFAGCIHHSLDAAASLLGPSRAWSTSSGMTVGRVPTPATELEEKPDMSSSRKPSRAVRARFRVVDSDHTFTGDSIGLAAGLVAYAQLLRPEVHKHERFIAVEAAFTGGLDPSGRLTPVSAETLKRKVERAFFSTIRYLVLPQANLDTARWCVNEMRRAYPNRQLQLIGAATLREVIDDLNIVRAERVCMGQFVARKAYKYTRATKIQVPLLLGLMYLLICLIYPKAWWGFDDNPTYSRFNSEDNTLGVFNTDSVLIWSHSLDCDIENEFPACTKVVDLDRDGRSEVLFSVPTEGNCAHRDTLFCYSHDHRLLFQKYCATPNEYPGDSGTTQYSPASIRVMELAGDPVIVTVVVDGRTGLGHIRFWSADGEAMGWYINAGGPCTFVTRDIDGDSREEAIFLSFNNPMGATAFLVLKPDSAFGVSPPYNGVSDLDLSRVKRGNQISYIVFPKTDLGEKDLLNPFNYPYDILADNSASLNAYVIESDTVKWAQFVYQIDNSGRVVNCWPTAQFEKRRDQLVEAGVLPAIDWEEYKARTRNAVLYWTDSGWVTEGRLRAAGQ